MMQIDVHTDIDRISYTHIMEICLSSCYGLEIGPVGSPTGDDSPTHSVSRIPPTSHQCDSAEFNRRICDRKFCLCVYNIVLCVSVVKMENKSALILKRHLLYFTKLSLSTFTLLSCNARKHTYT